MTGNKVRNLALIPARGGSKRIPRKNIIDFMGMPMIAHTLRAAIASNLFDKVHVSSDDTEILEISKKYGADISFERPKKLADDFTGILPVAKWVLEEFTRNGEIYDNVFILFPCSPLLEKEDLIGAYETFQKWDGKKNLLTIARSPVPLEWLYEKGENGQLIPRIPGGAFIRGQDLKPAYYETGTFTIFSADFLLNANQISDDTNYIGYELDEWKCVDIDIPKDLERAALIYKLSILEKG